MDVTGAILAGGQGRRMGGAVKSLIDFIDDNGAKASIYDRQRSVLSCLCARVIVSAAADTPWAVDPVVVDEFVDAGPLAGIHRVLKVTPQWALIVAGDMPFLRADVLRLLLDAASRATAPLHAIAFEIGGRPQPLCALFHSSALDVIAGQLANKQRRVGALLSSGLLLTHFVSEAAVRLVDPTLRHFHNVNSASDVNGVNQ